MLGPNDDGLRARLLTGTMVGFPMSRALWMKWVSEGEVMSCGYSHMMLCGEL